jgi:hypothetical protein
MAADPMMNAELGAAKACEEAFRLIRACAVIGLELAGVIDALHREGRVQDVPSRRLIGMHFSSARDGGADRRDCLALARHDPHPRLT